MKKNIAFLIANLSNSGGTQRILTHLCNLLIDEFNMIVMVNEEGKPFFPLHKQVKIININDKKQNLLQRNLKLYHVLKEHKVDYYINLDTNSVIANSLFLPKYTQLICWEHFSLETNYKKLFFTISRLYATKRASKFVLLSNAETRLWQHYSPFIKQKINLIYNPVTVNNPSKNENRLSYKKFLAIGNNIEVKGFDILIEAWQQQKSNWILQIVGLSDSDIKHIQSVIDDKNLKNVEVYGKVKNIQDFYQNSSVFVLSSRKEATPLVLIESQAFGLPAIIFNHLSGAIELVDDSAIVIDYKMAADSLAKAMDKIAEDNDLYHQLSKNALLNAERFSEEKFKQQWLEILK